jgi:enolase
MTIFILWTAEKDKEGCPLNDANMHVCFTLGVQKAVANVNSVIAPALLEKVKQWIEWNL